MSRSSSFCSAAQDRLPKLEPLAKEPTVALGAAMARGGATLGRCWLGTAVRWARGVEGQGQHSPPVTGGVSAPCSTIWHRVVHVTGGDCGQHCGFFAHQGMCQCCKGLLLVCFPPSGVHRHGRLPQLGAVTH